MVSLSIGPPLIKRLIGYGGIGATGLLVDLGVVSILETFHFHYLIVTVIAYQSAMTWNFFWQRRYVFESHNSIFNDYLEYLKVDVAALGVRTLVVTILLELALLHAPANILSHYLPVAVTTLQIASFIGIITAFGVGFLGTDKLVFSESQSS